jgi:hypothetical protein
MSLKYGVLSLLAVFIAFFLIFKNYETWTLPFEVVHRKVAADKGAAKKSGVKIEHPPTMEGQPDTTSFQSFIFVAEKNIFRPDRKDFPIVAPPPGSPGSEVKKPMVRPQIILYGVTIAGDYKSASIAHPGRALQKGEREIMTAKIGDRVGDYKLGKILPDRIALEAPEDNFEVLLYDPKVPKKRIVAKTENKPATITSTLPTSAATPAARPQPAPPGVGQPGETITGRVTETVAPGPLTPAPVPGSRTRRLPIGPIPRE